MSDPLSDGDADDDYGGRDFEAGFRAGVAWTLQRVGDWHERGKAEIAAALDEEASFRADGWRYGAHGDEPESHEH